MTTDNKITAPGSKGGRLTAVAVHLLAIGALFILPEMVSSIGRPFQLPWQLQAAGYLKASVFIGVFYINYLLVVPRSITPRPSLMRAIGWNLLIIAAVLFTFWLISEWSEPYWQSVFPHRGHNHPRPSPWLKNFKWMLRDSVMMILTIALATAMCLGRHYKSLRLKEDERRLAQRQQELTSLKEQLNPHFLFNTLNTIYALIAVNPDTAQEAVHQLSGMLRYVLYEDATDVPLRREAEFVQSYVRLMKLRLGSTTAVRLNLDLPDPTGQHPIAPLIFITLVENAFKHCDKGAPGSSVSIDITASGTTMTCRVVNTFRPDTAHDGPNGGIGLQNLRRRLKLIYGGDATLDISTTANHFTVNLTIKNLTAL